MTVQRGDSRIEMSEPDQDGRMGISIDTGPGEAKDYQLNWGAADPAQPAYTPGPDGKIHLEDAGLRITAERPQGETGPTVVTVDDGSGTPTTYTLGEEPADGQQAGHSVPGTPIPGEGDAPDPAAEQVGTAGRSEAAADGVSQPSPLPVDPSGVTEGTVPATVGGVADGLATEGALSGSLGDPGALDQPVPAADGATLGTVPDSGMVGGMPPVGAGAQDEPERTSRAYRVDGDIFAVAGSTGRISGSLDDEETS